MPYTSRVWNHAKQSIAIFLFIGGSYSLFWSGGRNIYGIMIGVVLSTRFYARAVKLNKKYLKSVEIDVHVVRIEIYNKDSKFNQQEFPINNVRIRARKDLFARYNYFELYIDLGGKTIFVQPEVGAWTKDIFLELEKACQKARQSL